MKDFVGNPQGRQVLTGLIYAKLAGYELNN